MNKVFLLLALVIFTGVQNCFGGGDAEDFARAQLLARRTEGKVFRDAVAPHWLPDNRHFWYRVLTGPDTPEYVLVDAPTGEMKRAGSAEELGLTAGDLAVELGVAEESGSAAVFMNLRRLTLRGDDPP